MSRKNDAFAALVRLRDLFRKRMKEARGGSYIAHKQDLEAVAAELAALERRKNAEET